jgi:DNA primase
MFPIHDSRGQVIGFGGRVLDDGEPKYLNSPETPLFSKGRELYGLFLARQAIREKEAVVVVEGYMDVVALAQHGVDYAVATLGHIDHVGARAEALPQSDRVIFCFDGDAAGTEGSVAGTRERATRARRRQECRIHVPARWRGPR